MYHHLLIHLLIKEHLGCFQTFIWFSFTSYFSEFFCFFVSNMLRIAYWSIYMIADVKSLPDNYIWFTSVLASLEVFFHWSWHFLDYWNEERFFFIETCKYLKTLAHVLVCSCDTAPGRKLGHCFVTARWGWKSNFSNMLLLTPGRRELLITARQGWKFSFSLGLCWYHHRHEEQRHLAAASTCPQLPVWVGGLVTAGVVKILTLH